MVRLLVAAVIGLVPVSARAGGDDIQLLVFTRTVGFHHDSIPAGIVAVEQIAAEQGYGIVATEDPTTFDPEGLAGFDVVVFLNTTGDVLDDTQQSALELYIQGGGGFVGIHSATDTEADWPWYVGLVGTSFANHPAPQPATIHVIDGDHPATVALPDPWMHFDEWYNFTSNPSGTVDVLLRLDESTYEGGSMGRDHPIAWAHEYDGGRSFYTALGHTIEAWSEPEFLAHVAGGIAWAAGGDEMQGTGTSGETSDGDGMPDSGEPPPASDDTTDTGAATTSSDPATGEPTDSGTDTADANAREDDTGCSCTTAAPTPAVLLSLVLVRARRRRIPARSRAGHADA